MHNDADKALPHTKTKLQWSKWLKLAKDYDNHKDQIYPVNSYQR